MLTMATGGRLIYGGPVGALTLGVHRKSDIIFGLSKMLCQVSLNQNLLDNLEQRRLYKFIRHRIDQVARVEQGAIVYYSIGEMLRLWYSREEGTDKVGSEERIANILDKWKEY